MPRLRAAALTYRVLVRQVVTPGKLVALGALGALMILVGWLVGIAALDGERGAAGLLRDGAGYADGFGLIIIVPIVALVFGSSVLGEAREDGTLVYLWLRPMDRGPIVVGAAAAAATAALPLTVIPTAVGGFDWFGRCDPPASPGRGVRGPGCGANYHKAHRGSAAATRSARMSCGGSATAHCVPGRAQVVLVGRRVDLCWCRKPIMWGIGYVLLWEGGRGHEATESSCRFTPTYS